MNRVSVTACVALGTIGAIAAAGSAASVARAGTKSSGTDARNLIVTLVTPTVNQEVLPDLSDPGLNNVITVRFSSPLNSHDIIDPQNVVNQLNPKCEFFDATFARLPGTPLVRSNVFTFDPFSTTTPVLPQGQFTLNMKSSIRNTRGRLLNNGAGDYSTTFTVGTDVYPPVLRKISPLNGQQGIGLLQPIVATFNEPIAAASLASTITVFDSSTNPPTAIAGVGGTGLKLARGGFDVVFTPDPCFGYPAKTTIAFNIQGYNSSPAAATKVSTTLTDEFKNKFTRDSGLQWTADPTAVIPVTVPPTPGQGTSYLWHSPLGDYDDVTGLYTMRFQTKGIKPSPQALRPGSRMNTIQYPPGTQPCSGPYWLSNSCIVSGQCVLYTTENGLGEMDLRAFLARYGTGITDFSQIAIVPNAPVRLGRPGGLVTDPRLITILGPNLFHTFIYVVDQATNTVAVVRSDNFQVMGRLGGFTSPRDVTIMLSQSLSSTTLYVSDFATGQVVAVDLEGISVNFTTQPGSPSPCAAIKDNQNHRQVIEVGQGPTGIVSDSYWQGRVFVCNTLENTVSDINPQTNKERKKMNVGGNPAAAAFSEFQAETILWGMIVNQGGLNDPQGSVSMYINSPPLSGGFVGAGQKRDGVETTFTDGIRNPTDVWGDIDWITPPPPASPWLTSIHRHWFVANTGGTTVTELNVAFTGVFGVSVDPVVKGTTEVGRNPTGTIPDSYFPDVFCFAASAGTGSFMGFDPARSIPATAISAPGIRKLYTPYSD
jgi:YVTN family beta-propeller protein